MIGLLLALGAPLAADVVPIVPLAVPGRAADPSLGEAPARAVEGTVSLGDGLVARWTLGTTLVEAPGRGFVDAPCTCDTPGLACTTAIGRIGVSVEAPERIPRADLGLCHTSVGDVAVSASIVALPDPWEVSPRHWVVPVDARPERRERVVASWAGESDEDAAPVAARIERRPILFLPKPRRWRAPPASPCAMETRGDAFVLVLTGRPDGDVVCAEHRRDGPLWVRATGFTMPWETSPVAGDPEGVTVEPTLPGDEAATSPTTAPVDPGEGSGSR